MRSNLFNCYELSWWFHIHGRKQLHEIIVLGVTGSETLTIISSVCWRSCFWWFFAHVKLGIPRPACSEAVDISNENSGTLTRKPFITTELETARSGSDFEVVPGNEGAKRRVDGHHSGVNFMQRNWTTISLV
jgi:hypothetical protein